jgi:hypothetical protein
MVTAENHMFRDIIWEPNTNHSACTAYTIIASTHIMYVQTLSTKPTTPLHSTISLQYNSNKSLNSYHEANSSVMCLLSIIQAVATVLKHSSVMLFLILEQHMTVTQ